MRTKVHRMDKVSILKLEDIKKSYERRDCESVDEKNLCLEKRRKKNSCSKGLTLKQFKSS